MQHCLQWIVNKFIHNFHDYKPLIFSLIQFYTYCSRQNIKHWKYYHENNNNLNYNYCNNYHIRLVIQYDMSTIMMRRNDSTRYASNNITDKCDILTIITRRNNLIWYTNNKECYCLQIRWNYFSLPNFQQGLGEYLNHFDRGLMLC